MDSGHIFPIAFRSLESSEEGNLLHRLTRKASLKKGHLNSILPWVDFIRKWSGLASQPANTVRRGFKVGDQSVWGKAWASRFGETSEYISEKTG